MLSVASRSRAMATYTKWMLGFALALLLTPVTRAERLEGSPQSGETLSEIHDRAAEALVQGRLEDALVGFNRIIELNPRIAKAYYNRGSIYYAYRDYDRAISDFDKAVRLDPTFTFAYMNLGIAYSDVGRFKDALQTLDRAVSLDVKGSDALYNRAVVHGRLKDYTKAIADYEAAAVKEVGAAEAIKARDRLMRLLDRSPGEKGKALSFEGIDPALVSTEIMHARLVEHVLRLSKSSCLSYGNDAPALQNFAREREWRSASPESLAKGHSLSGQPLNGWNFADRFGRYAVMQSTAKEEAVTVCSLTTPMASHHLMEDFKTAFEAMFDIAVARDTKKIDLTEHQYRIQDGARSLGAAIIVSSSALTLRFVFRKDEVKQ